MTEQTAANTQESNPHLFDVDVNSPKAKQVGAMDTYKGQADLGADLDAMVERFGADKVHNLAVRMALTDIGNRVRAMMNPKEEKDEDGNTTLVPGTSSTKEEIDQYVAEWRPGIKATPKSVDPAEALLAKIKAGGLSKEKALEIFQAMKAAGIGS